MSTQTDVVQQASVESVVTAPAPSPVAARPHDHSSGGHSHEVFRSESIPTHGPAVIIPVDNTLVPDSSSVTGEAREIPLDVFTAAALTQVPTSAPPPPTGLPTTVEPTLIPTVSSSDSPSHTPSSAPVTEAPSGMPSDAPSDSPSDAPSSSPSALVAEEPSVGRAILDPETEKPAFPGTFAIFIPRPDDDDDDAVASTEVRSALGSDIPSMVPSDMPSLLPSDLPSTIPSDAPSMVPAVYDGGAAGDAVVFMDAQEIDTFEQVCGKEFLMHFLPWVNVTECTDIVCEVVSQKEATARQVRRVLKKATPRTEVEYNLGGIDVLIEVSCENDLPKDSDFPSSVQRAFDEFGDEFEEDLKSESDFFEFDAIQGSTSSGGGRERSSRRAMALGITGAALVGGALLALLISFFILRRARDDDEDDDLPTHRAVEPVVDYLKPGTNGEKTPFEEGPSFIPVGREAARPPPVEIPPAGREHKETSSRLISEVTVTKEASEAVVATEIAQVAANEADVESIDPPESNSGSSTSGSCAKSPKSPVCVTNKYCSPRKTEPEEELQLMSPDLDDSTSQTTDDAQDVRSAITVATDAVLPASAGSPMCAGAYDFFTSAPAKAENQKPLPYTGSFSPSKSSKVSFKLDEDEHQEEDPSNENAMETGTASLNAKVVPVEPEQTGYSDDDEDEVIPSSPRSRWLQGIFNKQNKAKKTRLQDQHDYESPDEEGDSAEDESSELSSWKQSNTADAEKVLTDLDQFAKKSDAMTPKQDNTASSKPYWNN